MIERFKYYSVLIISMLRIRYSLLFLMCILIFSPSVLAPGAYLSQICTPNEETCVQGHPPQDIRRCNEDGLSWTKIASCEYKCEFDSRGNLGTRLSYVRCITPGEERWNNILGNIVPVAVIGFLALMILLSFWALNKSNKPSKRKGKN